MARRPQSPALRALYDRYIGDDPERTASYEAVRAEADIAEAVYRLRMEAGLTQNQLAKRVGTTASVISRMEDADYEGHSLSMVRRIADAVAYRVEIRFVPESRSAAEPISPTKSPSANQTKRPTKKATSSPTSKKPPKF